MKEKQTKSNSKAVLSFIAIILVVVTMISLALGLFAWSKYTAGQNGTATAEMARWNFNLSLTSGQTTVTGNQTLDLADTLDQEATHVADGMIAPGTSGTFDIVIDTTGTEVSMVYDVTITTANCPRNIKFSKKGPGENSFTEISPMQTGDTTTRARTINFSKYLRAQGANQENENGIKTETIKWEWPYELTGNDPETSEPYTDEQKTAYDTRDNQDQGQTVTIDITAVGTEVMNAPLTEATIIYTKGNESRNLNNGDTVTIQRENEMIDIPTLSLSSGTESVTYTSSQTSVATINENGELTLIGTGTTAITLTGNETGKTFTVNVTVRPNIELQVGDTILYTPSTVNTYSWDQTLATSSAASDAQPLELKSGAGQSYNISQWYVLSIDGDNITMVPKTPSGGTVTLQGAQGYNNAVKLLNDACSTLYSDSSKGITARSIKIEDIENVIKTYGNESTLTTAQTSAGYNTQKYNAYSSSYSKYPEIYASENQSVINENTNDSGLVLSAQSTFIQRAAGNNDNGSITNATSIQPYQTYYYLNNDYLVTALGGSNSIYRKVLLNNSTPNYWVASRCVDLYSYYCGFIVSAVDFGYLYANNMFDSSGDPNSNTRGLFPVVSLSSDVLTTTGTAGTYQVQ